MINHPYPKHWSSHHILHQWPYAHPFVSAAQNQAGFGDALPAVQWALFVKAWAPVKAPLRCQTDIFAQWCASEEKGEELAAWAEGHVAPNEVLACHRASHQPVSRHAHLLNSTPCKTKEDVPPTCLCSPNVKGSVCYALMMHFTYFCLIYNIFCEYSRWGKSWLALHIQTSHWDSHEA